MTLDEPRSERPCAYALTELLFRVFSDWSCNTSRRTGDERPLGVGGTWWGCPTSGAPFGSLSSVLLARSPLKSGISG